MKKLHSHFKRLSVLFLLLVSGWFVHAQTVRINEFMALNVLTLADEDGDYPDWIEIYNPAGSPVNMKGWALTDDADMPFKWVFPELTLQPNKYLIVFASSKNRTANIARLHTNFSLNGAGEYLALVRPDGTAATEFAPAFPPQMSGVSYGFYSTGYAESANPTPGKENIFQQVIIVPPPVFSHKHGFYTNAFQLELFPALPGQSIYYTTDGSTPTKTNGTLYTAKIPVSRTTIVRAVAVSENVHGKVATQSYFFADDIIRQNNTPAGYPAAWGPYTAITGNAVADYEMDQDLLSDPLYANAVKKAFTEIPSVSVVTDKGNLFSSSTDPETGGIYIYTGAPITNTTYATGRGWERPISLEFFSNDFSFQVNCGIRLQGGHGRRPEKSPKHSFLLVFDKKYGPSKLEYPLLGKSSSAIFENVILRAGFGNSWVHQENSQRTKATYQEDIWTKDTQRAMGHPAANARYVHLFLNGLYWGMYMASERMDKEFGETYLGGDEDNYDVIKDYSEVADGNIDAWNKLMSMANAGLETNEKYNLIQGKNPDGTLSDAAESMVDVVNLADYMLINFYGGNGDWDHHNWAAMRSRVNPGKGFKFLCWDAEIMFGSVTANILNKNNDNCPSRVYQQLLKNAEFKRLLADRIQRHCFNGGVLTPQSAIDRWNTRKAQIENVIHAEAARWGDYRRDVHPYQAAGPFALYKKDTHWLVQQNFMLNTYFVQRTANFVSHLRTAGLFPSVDGPVFYINSKSPDSNVVAAGDKLSMTTAQGTVYYTTNGADPVNWPAGTVNTKDARIYTQPHTITQSANVVARTYYNGQWSAASARHFVVPENYADIKITEIHYHPQGEGLTDNSEFEFIELKNTGTSVLDLGGMKFTRGIEYVFPYETQLGPGEFVVLAENSNHFYTRYKFRAFGQYIGKLDNAGERLTLISPLGTTIADFAYGIVGNWPAASNGQGYSMVPVVYNPTGDQSDAAGWRASHQIGGSPGADDMPPSGTASIAAVAKDDFLLSQNFPNPFINKTYIDYQLSSDARVELSVYNLMGMKVATLENAFKPAGLHQVEWNGTDISGNQLTNGVYFYRLTVQTGTGRYEITRKMQLKR